MSGPGVLVFVVGASGAGKDSIIAGAAERLRADDRIVFARRAITRPAGAGGEDHLALSAAEFAAWRNAGSFLLHWHAHGLDYGLPGRLAWHLAGGRVVVANVSRTVIGEARRCFAPLVVVAVSASSEVRAARLAGRGREEAAEVESRLRRAEELPLDADIVIDNDGPLETAVERFVDVLGAALPQPDSG